MTLRTKFIVFIIVIHTTTVALSFFIFRDNKLLFIGSEFFIFLSLAISWQLYSEMIQPMQLLVRGIDALQDRDFNVKFVDTGKPEMDKLVHVYNAMIDQIRTERTVQQEQHFFLDKLIQTSPTGILIFDFDGKITTANPKAVDLLGLTEKEIKAQTVENQSIAVLKKVFKIEIGNSETINTEGGKIFKIQKSQFIDRGFHRLFVLIEELTAEILAAEKQAYGKVIRMMAHEVNNSIGAVNSILDTSLAYEKDAAVAHALKIAMERNDHLNYFMRNFADVIRLPEPHFETVIVKNLVKDVSDLMLFKAKEKNIVFDPTEMSKMPPLSIRADKSQLEQVLINVVKNAIEAIDNQGFIRFSLSENPRQLVISNNGKPIPKEVEPFLFSPFFTDKNGGQGIGLTLIRDILSNHQFSFSLKTRADGWTCFSIGF